MKRLHLVTAVAVVLMALAVVLGFAYLRAPHATRVKAGDWAPELELPSLGVSAKTQLSSLRGGPVLLVLFVPGDPVSEAETGEIERLNREFLRRGLRVIGVSVDAGSAAIQGFVERHGITFIILTDPEGEAVRAVFGTERFPEAYLIDSAGKVDAVYVGSTRWRDPDVRDRIKRLLTLPES